MRASASLLLPRAGTDAGRSPGTPGGMGPSVASLPCPKVPGNDFSTVPQGRRRPGREVARAGGERLASAAPFSCAAGISPGREKRTSPAGPSSLLKEKAYRTRRARLWFGRRQDSADAGAAAWTAQGAPARSVDRAVPASSGLLPAGVLCWRPGTRCCCSGCRACSCSGWQIGCSSGCCSSYRRGEHGWRSVLICSSRALRCRVYFARIRFSRIP